MKTALITGGSGFFGRILKKKLLENDIRVVNIDFQRDEDHDPKLISVQADIRNENLMSRLFRDYTFDTVYHCAAILAHAVKDKKLLWTSNVDGTRVVAEAARKYGVSNLVFTSSNCLWGRGFNKAITEEEPPGPIEIYGESKWEGEKILNEYRNDLNIVSIRCPTIIDFGRLGLLAILFEFIEEGRKVWTVGPGNNRYQFIYAQDLADACVRAANSRSGTFNIGSDNVRPMREVYQYVIERAHTGARIAQLPKGPTLRAMRAAHYLGVSPLGPYHYKMIAENFLFDTAKIKTELGWRPTLSNEEMLYQAFHYYQENRRQIEARVDVSAHRQAAKMGIIRLLKWVS